MARKITQSCVTLGYDLNLCRSQISLKKKTMPGE